MQLAQNIRVPFSELDRKFRRQHDLSREEPPASLALRRDRLSRLLNTLEAQADALVRAMSADFGHRAPHESETYDINGTISDIRQDLRHVARWMRPRKVP